MRAPGGSAGRGATVTDQPDGVAPHAEATGRSTGSAPAAARASMDIMKSPRRFVHPDVDYYVAALSPVTCADSARVLEMPRRAGSRAAVAGSNASGSLTSPFVFAPICWKINFASGRGFWEIDGVSVSTVAQARV